MTVEKIVSGAQSAAAPTQLAMSWELVRVGLAGGSILSGQFRLLVVGSSQLNPTPLLG